jgi:hypothetical protein
MADNEFRSKYLDEIMDADEAEKAKIATASAPKKKIRGFVDTLGDSYIGRAVKPRKEYGEL